MCSSTGISLLPLFPTPRPTCEDGGCTGHSEVSALCFFPSANDYCVTLLEHVRNKRRWRRFRPIKALQFSGDLPPLPQFTQWLTRGRPTGMKPIHMQFHHSQADDICWCLSSNHILSLCILPSSPIISLLFPLFFMSPPFASFDVAGSIPYGELHLRPAQSPSIVSERLNGSLPTASMLPEAIHGSLLDSLSVFNRNPFKEEACANFAPSTLGGLRRAYSSHRCGLDSLDVDMSDERPTSSPNV